MSLEILSQITDRCIQAHEETGAAVVITKDGREVFSTAAGYADKENHVPFKTDTICRAFSCSKVSTAVACMILITEGRLDTGWNVEWLIPEFGAAHYIRDGKRLESPPVKIRDLLNMTSGAAYPGDGHEGAEGTNDAWYQLDESIKAGRSMTTQQFAALIGRQPLMFPAGQEWMYGSSADILGAVIEKCADMPLAEFMKKRIFEPLGMEDTAFYCPADKRERLAVLYEGAGEAPKKAGYVNLCIYDYDSEPAFASGGAGLFSTASDHAKLGAELSSGGGAVLSRAAVDFLRTNGLDDTQRRTFDWDAVRGFGYGNLVRVLEDRNAAGLLAPEGSFGWDGWTGTYLLCSPESGISVTVFTQRCGAGTTQLARNIVNAAFAKL